MPTYQYVCTECGEDLEAVQKFSDDPLTECPSCGGRLRKRFSAVGVVFKGSGFYKTDSRSGSSSGGSSKPKTETPAASSGDSSSSSSSTPAAKESSSAPAASSNGSSSSTSTSAA